MKGRDKGKGVSNKGARRGVGIKKGRCGGGRALRGEWVWPIGGSADCFMGIMGILREKRDAPGEEGRVCGPAEEARGEGGLLWLGANRRGKKEGHLRWWSCWW